MFAKHSQVKRRFKPYFWEEGCLFIIIIIKTTIFRFNGPSLLHEKGYNDVIHLRALESGFKKVSKFIIQFHN